MKPTAARKTLLGRVVALSAVALIFTAAASGALFAKSTTWTNASPLNDLWSNADNWSNGVPVDYDDVSFSAIGGTSRFDLPSLMLYNLDMTGYTGTLTATDPLLVIDTFTTSGVVDAEYGAIQVAGNLVVGGTMNASGAAIAIGGSLHISGELDCDPWGLIDLDGNITGSPGAILNMGSGVLNLGGNGSFADFASVSWSAGGALNCKGASGTRLIDFGSSTVALRDVTVTRGSASAVTQIGCSGTLVIDGNLSVSKGVLQPMASEVEFRETVTVRGEFEYSEHGGILRFAAGSAGTVDVTGGGTLTILGITETRTRLRQDGVPGGPQWILAHDGTSIITIDAAEVQDSDASGGSPVPATNSADKGNNTNWNFIGPKTTEWTGESLASTNWSDPLNWDLGSPQTGDDVVFDTAGTSSTMDIPSLTIASLNMSCYPRDLAVMYPLAVTGDMTTGYGTIDLQGNPLAVAGTLTCETINAEGASILVGGNLRLHGLLDCDPGGSVNVDGTVEGLPGGILDMGSGTLHAGGDMLFLDLTAAIWSAGGKLVCEGDSPVQMVFFDPLGVTLNDLAIEHSSGTQVTRLLSAGPAHLDIHGTLDVASGILELAEGVVVVDGATTIETNGRLEVNTLGANAIFKSAMRVRGALSYKKAGGAVRFAAGPAGAVDITNGGVFEVVGTPTSRIYLQQDGVPGGDRWTLMHDGTSTITVDCVELQDGEARGPSLAAAMNSIDSGNNLNWYFGTVSEADAPPLRLALEAAPNPFNPATTVRYALPRAGSASIRIYDASGALVRTLASGFHAAGRYGTTWDGRNNAGRRVGSGAYFCRLESNGTAEVRKLLLLR